MKYILIFTETIIYLLTPKYNYLQPEIKNFYIKNYLFFRIIILTRNINNINFGHNFIIFRFKYF
jgi:hypothetical protein